MTSEKKNEKTGKKERTTTPLHTHHTRQKQKFTRVSSGYASAPSSLLSVKSTAMSDGSDPNSRGTDVKLAFHAYNLSKDLSPATDCGIGPVRSGLNPTCRSCRWVRDEMPDGRVPLSPFDARRSCRTRHVVVLHSTWSHQHTGTVVLSQHALRYHCGPPVARYLVGLLGRMEVRRKSVCMSNCDCSDDSE